MKSVDVAIIGAGSAGLAAYRAVRAAGKSAVVIDRGPLGTTCARVGCMPSKLLIRAAEVAHDVAGAGELGIRVTGMRVDGAAVLARVRRERDELVAGLVGALDDVELVLGEARFTDRDTIEIGEAGSAGGRTITAGAFVLAVGSSPEVPDVLASVPVLTSDTLFEVAELPGRVAVIGAGAVALELGQALMRLGSTVTLFSKGQNLGHITDPEVRRETLLHLGLDVRFGAKLTRAASAGGEITLTVDEQEHRCDAVLVAAGRAPNLARLQLERAGLTLPLRHDQGTLQCEKMPIFIAGDASGDHPVLHEAADDGHIAGLNAARFPDVRAESRRFPLSIVFTHPQIARVGAALDSLHDPAIGEARFARQGRARIMGGGNNVGVVRLYAERKSGILRGAELCGPGVEHLAHTLAWALSHEPVAADVLAMPFYHPVLEEALRTALEQLPKNS